MQQIADIFQSKKKESPKKRTTAYQWQDFALFIIKELDIPQSKKNSVFKICKDYDKNYVEKCMDDTKELAQGSGRWRYFFKLVSEYKKDKTNDKAGQGEKDELQSKRSRSEGKGNLDHNKKSSY